MAQPAGFQIDTSFLPGFGAPAEQKPAPKRNLFAAGLSSGIDDLQSLFGSAAQGTGRILGLAPLEAYGRGVAQSNAAESQANGRADLEVAPWKEGGASVAPWLGYQVAKQLPLIATYLAGGKAYSKLGGTAPQAVQELGMALPRSLGGGGLRTGADFATRRAAVATGARAAGQSMATDLVGGSIAGVPIAFGSMIQEADSKPGGMTDGDVRTAAMLSPIYSALDALQPAAFKGLLKRGSVGNIVRRVATASAVGAAAEVPQEGMQTALELVFRPDLSVKDKMSRIVDAAVTGGAVGGAFGGVGGIRRMKSVDPATIPTDELDRVTAEILRLPSPQQAAGGVPAPGTVVGVDGSGTGSIGPDEGYTPSEFDTGSTKPRPYKNVDAVELQSWLGAAAKVIKAGKATPEVLRRVEEVHEELVNRNPSVTSNMVSTDPVEAVQLELNQQRGAPGQNSDAPVSTTSQPWEATRDTLLKGVATRKWYRDASSPEELDTILRARLENGSTAKSDFELAKRRGIDVEGNGAPVEAETATATQPTTQTPVAVGTPYNPPGSRGVLVGEPNSYGYVSKGTAPTDGLVTAGNAEQPKGTPFKPASAAPTNAKGGDTSVDPAFQAQWKADVQKHGQKDKGARSIKPTSVADAQRQIYRALGADSEIGNGLENLAKQYGVLDDNKQLTPLAVEIAQKDPIKTQDAVKAAIAQGYKGAAASMFDRGVQAQLGGQPVTQFESSDASEAYTAGAQWAIEHNSVPRGALKKYQPKGYTGEVTDAQLAAARGEGNLQPQARVVPPEVAQKQTLNKAIDATRDAFATPDDDIAQLKRMVRDGDIEGAMQGLQQVQSGKKLFMQPASQPIDFKGEVVTRGAPRAGRVGSVTLTERRDVTRAEADRAIRKYELQRAIDGQFNEGTIDGATRMKLIGKLRQGKIADVVKVVGSVPSGRAVRPTSLQERTAQREALREQVREAFEDAVQDEVAELAVDGNGVLRAARFSGEIDAQDAMKIQRELQGKTAEQVMDWLQDSSNGFTRTVARKMALAMSKLKNAGFKFEFKIARQGMEMPEALQFARGVTIDNINMTTEIWVNGADFGVTRDQDGVWADRTGMSEEVILHEMLHAVTMQSVDYADTKARRNTPLGKAVADLWKVRDAIKAHLSNRSRDGNLTEMEKFILDTNATQNADEVLAWALSSADFQSYLDTIDYTPRQTLWGKFVEAMRTFLGLAERQDTALVEVLRISETILDLGPNDLRRAGGWLGGGEAMMQTKGAAAAFNANARTVVDKIAKAIPIDSATAAIRRTVFGWNSVGHLVAHYAKQFPQLALYAKAHLERRATQARWAQLFEAPYQVYEKMERTDPKVAESIRYLMSLTEFEIDPTKTWDQHEHLHGAPNEKMLKERVEGANRKYNTLRGLGHAKIYDDFRAINEATHLSMMSVSLHNLVASDPVLKAGVEGFDIDPTDAFRERPALHESPKNAQRYWSDMLDNQVKRAEEYITELRGETVGSASEKNLQSMRLEPIEMRLRSIKQSLQAMRNAPYFHLGRHGEHFVSFTLRTGSDKNVDPDAINAAGAAIQKAGFKHVEISRDSTRPNVYIRVDTIEARKELEQVVEKLKKDGWLKPDSEIKAAPRSSGKDTGTADVSPAWLERYIELLQASPMFEPADNMTDAEKAQLAGRKAQMVSHARELWLDMLPDTALSKVMVHRNAVPGFDRDMIRNFAFRFQVGVNALSNLSSAAKLNDAFTQMKVGVNDAQVSDGRQHADVDLLQSLMTEVQIREAQRPLRSGTSWIDTWRALNHAFFLGFSPSYVMVNMTQLGVLLWPELAKNHGFTKAAGAIGSVTGTAFKIMAATMKHGASVGWKRAADAVITEDVLKAAGVDDSTAEFLMKIIADGVIDIGGSSRELGRVADASVSSKLDTGLRYAAAAGLYSETFTRLVAALAARKLNGDDLAYTHKVIDQSMLNYADWNTARQMGKMGFAGPMTKVMTAFMQYSVQVMEKLYRELHAAFISKASSPQEKAEARRFLAGHLTAVTALAGTLGMPFATVAAMAVEKLVDLFDDDDEPYDATAAWRNFMADIFGKDLGEVISRGAPRAGGIDLSQRAGEQNLIPFTQFLTDKRKWREAAAEQSLRQMGSPVSMVINIFEGGEKIAAGDLLGGMAAAAPLAVKGPVQAYRMTTDGYIDTKGNKLPMTPGSLEILAQLAGFTPAEKAEYSEERGDQAARKSVLTGRAKDLRDKIVNAVVDGDPAARDYIAEAQAFDRANPAFAVLPDIGAGVKRRARVQAIAATTRTPVGVSQKDLGAQELTRYSNIDYRAQ